MAIAADTDLEDGTPADSFTTLVDELSTIVRNTSRAAEAAADVATFYNITTEPNAKQRHAFELLQHITLQPVRCTTSSC